MVVTVTVDPAALGGKNGLAQWVQGELTNLVRANRILIRRRLVKPLYESGVRFREEPLGVETFVDALTCMRAGHGDCAHLCAWRCAELREKGERATIRIKWKHPYYHVQVRRTRRVNQQGVDDPFVEDPSRILGMGT